MFMAAKVFEIAGGPAHPLPPPPPPPPPPLLPVSGMGTKRLGTGRVKLEKRENRLFLQNYMAFTLSNLVKYVMVLGKRLYS